jgi:hypothetical protein
MTSNCELLDNRVTSNKEGKLWHFFPVPAKLYLAKKYLFLASVQYFFKIFFQTSPSVAFSILTLGKKSICETVRPKMQLGLQKPGQNGFPTAICVPSLILGIYHRRRSS